MSRVKGLFIKAEEKFTLLFRHLGFISEIGVAS